MRFDATEEPEFESSRWVDYWTPVREVIYFKRAVYARALDELAHRAFPEDPPPLPEWSAQEKNLRNIANRRKRVTAAAAGQNGLTTTRITIAISSSAGSLVEHAVPGR